MWAGGQGRNGPAQINLIYDGGHVSENSTGTGTITKTRFEDSSESEASDSEVLQDESFGFVGGDFSDFDSDESGLEE